MTSLDHEVSVVIGRKSIARWTEYDITTDMMEPADQFTMSIAPISKEIWNLVVPDAPIQVWLDDAPVLNGFIGSRQRRLSRTGGSVIEIQGMDKGGRLTRESMDLIAFKQKTLGQLVQECVEPWFDSVVFSNDRNRNLLRGRRTKKVPNPLANMVNQATGTRVGDVLFPTSVTVTVDGLKSAKDAPRKVAPGQSRWEVIAEWLEGSGLIAWSSGDGEEFVIGVPAYNQPAQWRFVLPGPEIKSPTAEHAIDWNWTESTEERYSQIQVVGAVRGSSSNYGKKMVKNAGVATDGPGLLGTGGAFSARKTLVIQDDSIRNRAQAEKRAEHEMALRDGSGETLEILMPGHGQLQVEGKPPTLYCPDTVAEVVDDEMNETTRWLVTRCTYTNSRASGQQTQLSLIPEGSEVAL